MRPAALLASVWLVASTVGAPAHSAESTALDRVRLYRQAHAAAILSEFRDLLAIPNVASDKSNIRANAEWLAAAFERRGVATEVWAIAGASPVVYGSLRPEGATRTIGIYAHYDGQPVDASSWDTNPWRPVLLTAAIEDGGVERSWPEAGDPLDPEWRIYARSAGDDKAPLAALLGALDALGSDGSDGSDGLPITSNLVLLFEGEEEAGSGNLGAFFRQHRQRLDVDLWLIADGPVHQSRQPQLVFGVRGYTGFDITVYGATRYLHSGHYGNWAPNPAQELAALLASMKDRTGKVTIEGFYDDTAPITAADRAAIAALPDYDQTLRRELGLHSTEASNGPLAERILLPSLNIRGMKSATVGAKARNIIPTEATASIDIRLAKGDHPETMLDRVEAHVRQQGFEVVDEEPDLETRLAQPRIARIVRRSGYPAVRTRLDHPAFESVLRAAEAAAGGDVLMVPSLGGSLPLYLFEDILKAPVVITPIANHDNNQHAPNENLRLANLWYGIDLMASFLTMD